MALWNEHFYSQPWRQMDVLLREMNDLFSNASQSSNTAEFPPVNMWGNENEIILTAELPGIDAQALNIQALEDTLFIEGQKQKAQNDAEQKIGYYRKERFTGKFKRAFQLPYTIEPEKVEAKYEKGILQIVLPRSEKEKPKQIKVSIS